MKKRGKEGRNSILVGFLYCRERRGRRKRQQEEVMGFTYSPHSIPPNKTKNDSNIKFSKPVANQVDLQTIIYSPSLFNFTRSKRQKQARRFISITTNSTNRTFLHFFTFKNCSRSEFKAITFPFYPFRSQIPSTKGRQTFLDREERQLFRSRK